MKENPKLKEVIIKKNNFVNDDKLAREIIEAQEKWDLAYKAGMSCAKKEGHATGLAEGISRGHFDVAKKLLKIKMDIDTISKVTGLTKDEILKLK